MLRAACLGIAIAVAAAVAATGGARGAPRPAPMRVVLADPDPELLRALRSSLAPWRIEVIAEPRPPTDQADAEARAAASGARFAVWRRGRSLVVLDRERDEPEERDATAGPLDPVGAASAALTVKTLMRLPPPPPDEPTDGSIDDPGGTEARQRQLELRGQAAIATRLALGSSTEVSGRFLPAVLVRPLPQLPWRLGITIDVGSTASIQRATFKGTWSDWAVIALTSWTLHRRAWEIEPQLGAGVARSSLEGTEISAGRHETATLALLRAGITARRRFGRWTVGGLVGVDKLLGTPTYTRVGSSAQIFEVPGVAVALGALAAADFGGAGW